MTLIVVYGLYQVIHRLLGDQVVVYLLVARSFGARDPLLEREGEHIIERGPTFHDLARPVIEVGLSPPCLAGLCLCRRGVGLTLRVRRGSIFRRCRNGSMIFRSGRRC